MKHRVSFANSIEQALLPCADSLFPNLQKTFNSWSLTTLIGSSGHVHRSQGCLTPDDLEMLETSSISGSVCRDVCPAFQSIPC